MGILGPKEEESFTPDCKVVSGSSDGTTQIECRPTLSKGGKVIGGDRPTQLVTSGDQQIGIVDDGGAPEEVLRRAIDWVKNNLL